MDVTPAAWIGERFQRLDLDGGMRLGQIIPTGFDGYARIFHPAREVGDPPVGARWEDLASKHGRVVHPEMQFAHIVAAPNLDTSSGSADP